MEKYYLTEQPLQALTDPQTTERQSRWHHINIPPQIPKTEIKEKRELKKNE